MAAAVLECLPGAKAGGANGTTSNEQSGNAPDAPVVVVTGACRAVGTIVRPSAGKQQLAHLNYSRVIR